MSSAFIESAKMKPLSQINDKDVPFWSFKGTYDAKITDVHDGDTCHAILLFHGEYIKLSIRMMDYDAPELKGPSADMALNARRYLSSLIFDRIVKITLNGNDKYGRTLGRIILTEKNEGNGEREIDVNKEMATRFGIYGRKEYLGETQFPHTLTSTVKK